MNDTADRDTWLRRGQWIAIGVALLAAGVMLTALPVAAWIEALRGTIEPLGWWGPVLFALAYMIGATLLLPSGPFQVGAGLLFGLGLGIATALAGTWLALTSAFVVGRWLARDRVQAMLESRPRVKAVEEAIADGGWKVVVLLRLSPLLPMSLHNYVYGVTRLSLWRYLPAAAIAVTPGTVMWAWIGSMGAAAATVTADASIAKWALRGAGLVATVVVSILLARKARARLEEQDLDLDGDDEGDDEAEVPSPARVFALGATALVLVVAAVLGRIYTDQLEQWLA